MPVESGLLAVSSARDAQKRAIRHSKQIVTLVGDLTIISGDFG